MKNLEDTLNRMAKPEVKVETFRQNLRQDLLNSHRYRSGTVRIYKSSLAVSFALSVLLVGVLVLFVADPSYPHLIHDAIKEKVASLSMEEKDGRVSPLEAYNVDRVEGKQSPDKNQIGQDLENPLAVDQAFVRYWAEQTFASQPIQVQPLRDSETYTVSRFRLNNGKRIQVFTFHPAREMIRQVSY
jgi:hypothetical protein